MFGSKKSTKTTTSESLTNLGTSLTSGGDIQLRRIPQDMHLKNQKAAYWYLKAALNGNSYA